MCYCVVIIKFAHTSLYLSTVNNPCQLLFLYSLKAFHFWFQILLLFNIYIQFSIRLFFLWWLFLKRFKVSLRCVYKYWMSFNKSVLLRTTTFLGENICYEVMSSVANSINGNVYSDSVTYRAKFSAITDKDIKAAFNNLCKYYFVYKCG